MSLYRDPPETRYVDTGDGHVGYQVFGAGPPNIVFRTALDSNAEAMWDQPAIASYFDRLASFGRVLYYDWRGTGISDPYRGSEQPTWDRFNDDATFAMEASGMDDAVFIGDREGGPSTMLFAATYPERVSALVLVNAFARFLRSDDYPIGMPLGSLEKMAEWMRDSWGSPNYYDNTAPSLLEDPQMQRWLGHYTKLAAAPGVIDLVYDFHVRIDVRSALASIQAPTLVIARRDASHHRPAFSRYLAEHIPNAKYLELPGADTSPFYIGDTEPVLDAIEEFVTGGRTQPIQNRTLATVMFTDIVNSTKRAAELGDHSWLDILEQHDRVSRHIVRQYQGRVIKSTGDGLLATFDGPTRAVTCADELVQAVRDIGLDIRIGLHTGEVEMAPDGDIGGLAVHIAARVMGNRLGSGVTASSTVKDLVAGSGIEFSPLGIAELKGVPGSWQLYELTPM